MPWTSWPLHSTSGNGAGEGQISFFAVGDDASAAIYVYRDSFTAGSYDGDAGRLTIWLGPVALTVEPQ